MVENNQNGRLQPRLPYSQVGVERQSIENFKLRMPDIFTDKETIGEGTFGKVYKAKIEGRLYALKKIKIG
jgi:serine/threonine protein kinase